MRTWQRLSTISSDLEDASPGQSFHIKRRKSSTAYIIDNPAKYMDWIERHIGDEEEGGFTYQPRKRTRSEAFLGYNEIIIEEEEQKVEEKVEPRSVSHAF